MAKKYNYKTATLRLPNGKRKYVRGKTKEELERKLAELKQELFLGVDVGDTTIFKDYADHWLKTTRETCVTPNTARMYRQVFSNHIYPVIGDMKIRDIKPTHIRGIMARISELGHGTQSRVLGLLTGVFNTAVDDNLILRSPVPLTMKAKGDATEESEPLTSEQEQALLEAAEGTMVYPFVFTILHTGMRKGEVMGLMWADVDFDEGVIHVRRHVVPDESGAPMLVSGAKTEAGVRDIPMPDALAAYLKGLQRTARSVYVFPNSKGKLYSSSALSSLWVTLDKRAGFHTHPHQLRHTYATKLFEQGLDVRQVQYVLGHADVNITLRIYVHYRESERRESTIRQVRAAFC